MALIKIKARVIKLVEEDFEWDDESMGSRPSRDNATWTWRTKAIDANNIYEITRVTAGTTMVEDVYGKVILVNEPFDAVYKKWEDNKTEDLEVGEEELTDENINNTQDDED